MENLKGNQNKVVGTKQVIRALNGSTASKVYVANDADTFLFQRVSTAAEKAGVACVRVETMKELGEACGVSVPTAAAALLR